jgi:hypothetical protein
MNMLGKSARKYSTEPSVEALSTRIMSLLAYGEFITLLKHFSASALPL